MRKLLTLLPFLLALLLAGLMPASAQQTDSSQGLTWTTERAVNFTTQAQVGTNATAGNTTPDAGGGLIDDLGANWNRYADTTTGNVVLLTNPNARPGIAYSGDGYLMRPSGVSAVNQRVIVKGFIYSTGAFGATIALRLNPAAKQLYSFRVNNSGASVVTYNNSATFTTIGAMSAGFTLAQGHYFLADASAVSNGAATATTLALTITDLGTSITNTTGTVVYAATSAPDSTSYLQAGGQCGLAGNNTTALASFQTLNAAANVFKGPTTAPNTALTGTLAGVMIGDSRTQYNGNALLTQLRANFPNATVNVYNAGQPGDPIEFYNKGNANGRYSGIVGYLNGMSATFAQIALGTNDKKNTLAPDPAVFQALYQNLVDNLYADVPTLRAVVAQEIPYTFVTGSGGVFDANSDARGIAYNAALGNLSRVTVGRGEYVATRDHTELTSADGVHPATTAAPNGGVPGVGPGYDAQTAYWAAALQPVLSALPTSQPPPPALSAAPALAAGTVPVVLTWGPLPARATAFRLYKDGGTVPIFDSPLLTYIDAVPPATAHTYALSAYNASGESAKTALTAAQGAVTQVFRGQIRRGR